MQRIFLTWFSSLNLPRIGLQTNLTNSAWNYAYAVIIKCALPLKSDFICNQRIVGVRGILDGYFRNAKFKYNSGRILDGFRVHILQKCSLYGRRIPERISRYLQNIQLIEITD